MSAPIVPPLFRTRLILWQEQLWAALGPLLGAVLAIIGLALHGLPPAGLPALLHLFLLLCVGLGLGLVAWRGMRRFVLPDTKAAAARLEVDADLPRGALRGLGDTPFAGDADSPLWAAHQAALAARLAATHPRRPAAAVDKADPYALRFAGFLVFVTGLLVAGDASPTRLREGLVPAFGHGAPPALDIWVSPPDYTGRAAIVLYRGTEAVATADDNAIELPINSVLNIRAGTKDKSSLRGVRLRTSDGAVRLDPQLGAHAIPLSTDALLQIRGEGGTTTIRLSVVADVPPRVTLTGPLTVEGGTRIVLPLDIADDYGIVTGTAEIALAAVIPRPPDGPRASAAAKLPQQIPAMALTGPPGARDVALDLTEHPFAGLPVRLRIIVTDGAGASATTQWVDTTLPMRTFYSPLSRAIIEQRRDLALEPKSWPRTAALLEGLTTAPELFARDMGEYLLLRTAYHDIASGEGQNIDAVVAGFWPLAHALEDEGLALARAQLEAAQTALREALARNAPSEEIDALVEALRAAMDAYVSALAESGEAEAPDDPDKDEISARDLGEMLDEIARLRRAGESAEARARLAELEAMLQNLRITPSGGGEPGDEGNGEGGRQAGDGDPERAGTGAGGGAPPQDARDAAGALIDRQRRLADQTFTAMRDGAGTADLADRQRTLENATRQLAAGLPQTPDADAARQSLTEAANAMASASAALARGDGRAAGDGQGAAIEALRRGAAAAPTPTDNPDTDGSTDTAGGQGQQAPGTQTGPVRDPAGRRYDSADSGSSGGEGTTVPDLSDPTALRRLSKQIRERLEDPSLPEAERVYLERLLDQF